MATSRARTRVSLACQYCGKLFEINPSKIAWNRGMYCSPVCQYAAIRARPKKSKILYTCIGCGIEFSDYASWLVNRKGAGKYCSRVCRDRYWRGPLASNWQGADRSHHHGPNWYSARRRALERDNRTCQKCNATDHLHVHHVIPGRLFASTENANALDNLITLCEHCHRREEALAYWATYGDGIGSEGGGALRFTPNGVAWNLAKQAGLI